MYNKKIIGINKTRFNDVNYMLTTTTQRIAYIPKKENKNKTKNMTLNLIMGTII